jgi:hypothetical protein
VVDRYFDPITIIGRKLFGIRRRTQVRSEEAGQAPAPAPGGAAREGKGPA